MVELNEIRTFEGYDRKDKDDVFLFISSLQDWLCV
jgi:hypothetical protein